MCQTYTWYYQWKFTTTCVLETWQEESQLWPSMAETNRTACHAVPHPYASARHENDTFFILCHPPPTPTPPTHRTVSYHTPSLRLWDIWKWHFSFFAPAPTQPHNETLITVQCVISYPFATHENDPFSGSEQYQHTLPTPSCHVC